MIFHFTSEMSMLIREFMLAFDQAMYPNCSSVPCEVAMLRAALIAEEAREFQVAAVRSVEELDAIIDLLYVTIGTNLALSVQVLPYSSGQIPLTSSPKQVITPQVIPVIQDLESRFPCEKIQFRALNDLIARLLDIAVIQGYKIAPAFKAVHAANMSKLHEFLPDLADEKYKNMGITATSKGDRYLVKGKNGKVIKPSNFTAPDLTSFL